MNGAEMLLSSAQAAGVDLCLANAGTTELPVVAAFDSVPGIRPVLALFEGVCTGAADGYGRMKDHPALTLLHLGPGFANGIANLHNARRAGTPLINLIGAHATWHRHADAPLAMDIEALAKTVSAWVRTNESVGTLSGDFGEAFSSASRGQIATLIVPSDHLWAEAGESKADLRPGVPSPLAVSSLEAAAEVLRTRSRCALMLGGRALRGQGLKAAGRISDLTGCDLLTSTFPGYVERGAGVPAVARIPYFPEPAMEMLARYEAVVRVQIQEPVTFFGYPGIESFLLHDKEQCSVGMAGEDVVEVLECLEDRLQAGPSSGCSASPKPVPGPPGLPPQGALTAEKACQTLAALQPEGAIIVDEGITVSLGYYRLTAGALPHSMLTVSGGSIGYGMPCATGAALACPDRPVINLQADGSAMYTVQALWTQAREGLNITTLLCSNRGYRILRVELERAGIAAPGSRALSLADIDRPALDWIRIASGMGVPACSVDTVEALARELKAALAEAGPHLIEMIL